MPFKTKKSGTILQKLFLYSFIAFLGSFYIEQSIAGSGTSPYADTLKNELIKSLIKENICKDHDVCKKMLQIQAAGYSKIYLSMYEQSNTLFFSHVASFFINEGLKITNGTTITLFSYPRALDYYNTFGNKEYFIKLELNKGKNHAL